MDMKKTLKVMNDIVEILGDVCEVVGKVAGKVEENKLPVKDSNVIDLDDILDDIEN